MEELWSLRRLAAYLGVSKATVYRLIAAGKLPKGEKNLTGQPRWDPDVVKNFHKVSQSVS